MTPDLKQWLADVAPDAFLADGLDEAIIGVVARVGQPTIVVYERTLCLEILSQDTDTYEQAEEHFEFNVRGAWVGPWTPAFLVRPPG